MSCCEDEQYPHTITIIARRDTDRYGQPVKGPSRTAPAFVAPQKTMVRMPTNESLVLGSTIITPDVRITIDDLIIMPTGEERVITNLVVHDYDEDQLHSEVTVA